MEETKTKRYINITFKITGAVLAFLILVILIGVYGFGMKDKNTQAVSRVFPFPLAFVGAHPVTSKSYIQRLELLEKVNGKLDSQTRDSVLDKLVQDKMVELLIERNNITLTNEDIDSNYSNIQLVTANPSPASSYGLNEDQFKKEVLESDTRNSKLAIWLANNKEINSAAYKTLDEVNAKLNNGEKLDTLAFEYSDDILSSKVGGNMGFVGVRDLEPEFYQGVSKVSDRNTHVSVTRYGIHIFSVGNKDAKGPQGSARFDVKHIFIKTIDFSEWLNEQKQNYKIIKLL